MSRVLPYAGTRDPIEPEPGLGREVGLEDLSILGVDNLDRSRRGVLHGGLLGPAEACQCPSPRLVRIAEIEIDEPGLDDDRVQRSA